MRLIILVSLMLPLLLAQTNVRYFATHQGGEDPHLPYLLALLSAINEQQGLAYQWQANQLPMNQARMQHSMFIGSTTLDLAWMMTNDDREQGMLAVPVPLFMGLIGWRIPLLPLASLAEETLWQPEDWLSKHAGQMSDWPDTDILLANGYPVVGASSYVSLFHMLAAHRFDYFPRSVIEIEQEHQSHQDLPIAMSKEWLLHYPTAMYFFVTPERPDLAEQLRQGLLALHESGRFERIFRDHYGDLIERLALNDRQVLTLQNPLLPAATPLDDDRLWLALPSRPAAQTN